MKKLSLAAIILIACSILSGSILETHAESADPGKPARVEQRFVTLEIPKMFCSTCPFIIRNALELIDGVISVKASQETKTAVVTYDKNKVSVKQLIEATTNVGYPSTERKKQKAPAGP